MAVKLPTRPKIEPITEPVALETPVEFVNFEQPDSFQVLDAHKMPDFPAKTIRADRDSLFFDWIDKLLEPDWTHVVVYVYREFPVIDRQQVNPKASKNIDCLSAKFDKEYIIREHGSGKYQFLVNDVNKAVKGKGGTVGYAYCEIEDANNPPKIVLDELVIEHPSNRRFVAKLKAEGKLTTEGLPMNTQGGTDNAALIGLLTQLINKQSNQQTQPKDATAESMANMFSKTHETAMAMLKDQVKSDDPDKFVKMIAALKEMMPAPNSGSDVVTLMLKMQTDMAKVQADAQASREVMMLKMMEMIQAKGGDEDKEDKILARIATYKELFGGGEGRGGKKDIWETVIEHGAPVLGKVIDTVQGFINIKNFEAGLKKQQAQTQPTTVELPAASPESQAQAPQPDNVVEMPNANTELITLIKGPAGNMILGALERNETGDAFADSIKIQLGRLTYDKIASIGKDGIIGAMQSVPEFWNRVVPSSAEKFVDEFIAYGTEEEDGEETN